MDSAPVLSVIVCTHNRAANLPLSLDSLIRQNAPKGSFEVIVVDNNSIDSTPSVVSGYEHRLPGLRYFFEPVPGLSQARNSGVAQAAGELVAFLDDDAAACPGWARALIDLFLSRNPRPACVGGPVELNWEGPQPRWVPAAFLSLYTRLELGPDVLALHQIPGAILMGANIAFDKTALIAAGGFSTKLGRKGKSLISGEETQLLHFLRQAGHAILYCPEARVSHLVLPDRRNPRFLRLRVIADGRSQILMDLIDGRLAGNRIRRRLVYDCKRLIVESGLWLGSFPGPANRRRECFYRMVRRYGRVMQLVYLQRNPSEIPEKGGG